MNYMLTVLKNLDLDQRVILINLIEARKNQMLQRKNKLLHKMTWMITLTNLNKKLDLKKKKEFLSK